MLLLILFAGCLATSVAQNFTYSVTTPAAFGAFTPEYVAILQAVVQYAGQFDLTAVTAQPILDELRQSISQQLQVSGISLKIRNITRV